MGTYIEGHIPSEIPGRRRAAFLLAEDSMDTDRDAIDYVRSRRETAQRLGVSVKTLRRMETRGQAPARVKITDRIIGYRDSAINAFLNARTAA